MTKDDLIALFDQFCAKLEEEVFKRDSSYSVRWLAAQDQEITVLIENARHTQQFNIKYAQFQDELQLSWIRVMEVWEMEQEMSGA